MHSFKPSNLFYVAFYNPKENENQIRENSKGVFVGRFGGKKEDPLVSWSVICKEKKHGGLGLRHLEGFNQALLGKWL